MNDKLFAALQYVTPQHTLSRAAGWLANTEVHWIKDRFIRTFAKKYQVNMDEAVQPDLGQYKCFNEFFTRPLKEDARPFDQDTNAIISPADGAVSQVGEIKNGRVFQAKGRDYSLTELLGGSAERAAPFIGGEFTTIYLSPKDYHRVHMPIKGTLKEMVYVPGQLFSVNPATVNEVDNLFARNERVVCMFETELGPMAMILVGAMIVASIETVWAGEVAPIRRKVKSWNYQQEQNITLEKGAEMGRFKLGSTVILCFPEKTVNWQETFTAEAPLKMGETIATK